MIKRLTFYVLSVLVVLAFIMSPISNAAPKKTIKLWTGYPERLPVLKAAAEDYMKEHPDVVVEVTAFDLRQSEQKFAISLTSGTGPDIFEGNHIVIKQYINDGMLSSAPAKHREWIKKNFDEGYIDVFSQDGKIYGIPSVQGFQVLYYNLDHYKEAGITAPPKTLDELMSNARKLAKYDDKGNLIRSGVSLRISGGGMGVAQKFEVFLFPNGGSVMEPTAPGKYKANFANEAGYQALNFYLQAIHKYKVDSFNIKHDSEAFVLGLASQFNRETWVIGEINKRAPGMNYGITQLVGGKYQGTNLNVDGWVIPASGKNTDIAWDFAVHFNKDKYMVQMVKEVGWICSRKGVDYSEVYKDEPHFEQALDRPQQMKMIVCPSAVSFNEVYTKFSDRLTEVFRDSSMVDNREKIMKFLRDAEEEANNIIKANGEYAK